MAKGIRPRPRALMQTTTPSYYITMYSEFAKAEARLEKKIQAAEARGNSTDFMQEHMAHLTKEIDTLVTFVKRELKKGVYEQFDGDVEQRLREMREKGIKLGDIAFDYRAVDNVLNNAEANILYALESVGRKHRDELRKAALRAVGDKLTMGETVKEMQRGLAVRLYDRGILSIEDRLGREWSLTNYTAMVARSTTREVSNIATLEAVEAVGTYLVQISSHYGSCPLCAPYQGRVYSTREAYVTKTLPPEYQGYPVLTKTAWKDGYANIHPNCRHVVTPYHPEFDPNPERTKAFSTRPFNMDPRTKAEKEHYEKEQREKRQRNADRKQYERYRRTMPGQVPKTFSGFRAMKRANSEKYLELRQDYRAIMASIKRDIGIKGRSIAGLADVFANDPSEWFKGMDPGLAREYEQELARVASKYAAFVPPKRHPMSDFALTTYFDAGTNVNGYCGIEHNRQGSSPVRFKRLINLNLAHMRTPQIVQNNAEAFYQKGGAALKAQGLKHVPVHEFAHMLDHGHYNAKYYDVVQKGINVYIRYGGMPGYTIPSSELSIMEAFLRVATGMDPARPRIGITVLAEFRSVLYEDLLRKNPPDSSWPESKIRDYNDNLRRVALSMSDDIIRRDLGLYAGKNPTEFFADGFAFTELVPPEQWNDGMRHFDKAWRNVQAKELAEIEQIHRQR